MQKEESKREKRIKESIIQSKPNKKKFFFKKRRINYSFAFI